MPYVKLEGVLLRGSMALFVAEALRQHRLRWPGDLHPDVDAGLHRLQQDLIRAGNVEVEAASAGGSPELPHPEPDAESPHDDAIRIDETAKLLGLTDRQARNLAPRLGGWKVGTAWRLSRAAVLLHLEQRDAT